MGELKMQTGHNYNHRVMTNDDSRAVAIEAASRLFGGQPRNVDTEKKFFDLAEKIVTYLNTGETPK